MKGRLLYLLPVALFAVVAGFFLVGLGMNPREIPSVLIDKPAPSFELPPLKEDKPGLATADFDGQVTLVNFFASWCIPCRVEHPMLMDLAAEGKVTVVGINYKDKPEDALKWLRQLGDPYGRIGADRDGRVAIDWGVYGVPESFVVDKAGRIRYKHVGPLSDEALKETVVPMMAELAK